MINAELNIDMVAQYLSQIEQWKGQVYLPLYWGSLTIREQIEKFARDKNPRLLPLLHTNYQARSDLVIQAQKREPIGIPIGDSIFFNSPEGRLRMLLNRGADQLQSSRRLLMAEQGLLVARNVYSEPVNPIFVDGNMLQERTFPSFGLNLLRHVETTNAVVLGWISFCQESSES